MNNRIEDKDGIWELNENGVTWDLIEPSQEFLDRQNNPPLDTPSEPTQEERILALEQALLNLLG